MELSEEEKKAIELLKNKNTEYYYRFIDVRDAVSTLLNLIEKLQKEIDREKQYTDFYEDLCNKQQKEIKEKITIIMAGAEKVKELEKGNRSLMESRIKWKDRYYKQLKELKEYNKQGQRLSNIMNSKDSYMYKSVCKNFVPKDKIRERIKEARKIRWHIPKLVIEYFEEFLEEN